MKRGRLTAQSAGANEWSDGDDEAEVFDGLDSDLTRALVKDGWDSERTLLSAFDSEEEALLLVASLSSVPSVPAYHVSWGKKLFEWAGGRSVKRAASIRASARFDFVDLARTMLNYEPAAKPLGLLLASIEKCCSFRKWRCRLDSAKALGATADERSRLEASELSRWTKKVVDYLVDADLPVVALAGQSEDPQTILELSVGSRRAKTLRSRCRAWNKISVWMQAVYGLKFPTSIVQMVDYVMDIRKGGASRSFPGEVSAALSFMEKAGNVPPEERISTSPLWTAAIQKIQKELQLEFPAEVRKAPFYTRAMILSIELYVMNRSNKWYRRLFALTRLLKLWMCLRHDDMQGLSGLVLGARGLSGKLLRTKTSGAGKKLRVLPTFIHRWATLSGEDWLAEGMLLMGAEQFRGARDFFLPISTRDFEGCRPKMASYSECSGLSRSLMLDLFVPVFRGGSWKESDVKLMTFPSPLYWSEHSERHWLPSAAADSRVPKDSRDFIGRWKPGQSNDYIITAKQVVLDVQQQVLEAIFKEGEVGVDDSEVLSGLQAFADRRGDSIGNTLKSLQFPFASRAHGGMGKPWVGYDVSQEPGEDWVGEAECSQASSDPQASALEEEGQFWVSIQGRSGFRRLHLRGACHFRPQDCANWESLHVLVADSADARCKFCWPSESAESEASTGSSSTDFANSAEIPDENLIA